jgi:hypothetical protein
MYKQVKGGRRYNSDSRLLPGREYLGLVIK